MATLNDFTVNRDIDPGCKNDGSISMVIVGKVGVAGGRVLDTIGRGIHRGGSSLGKNVDRWNDRRSRVDGAATRSFPRSIQVSAMRINSWTTRQRGNEEE